MAKIRINYFTGPSEEVEMGNILPYSLNGRGPNETGRFDFTQQRGCDMEYVLESFARGTPIVSCGTNDENPMVRRAVQMKNARSVELIDE